MGKIIISSSIFPKLTSDPKPIMLQIEEEEDLNHIPFRFSPLWKDRDGFMSTVSMAWDILVVGSLNCVWERKLKNTNWVKLSKKNPISERKEALEKWEEIQM